MRELDRVLKDAAGRQRLKRQRVTRPDHDEGGEMPSDLLGVDPKILGPVASAEARTPNLAELDERHIRRVLGQEHWNVSRAARVLDIHRATLYRKFLAFGIRPGRASRQLNRKP